MKTNTKRFFGIFLMCMMVCTVFPFVVSAAVVECPNCYEMSSFSTDYEQWTDTYHAIRGFCDNCGEDIYQGTNAGVHKMSGGECTLCGYSDTCYHDYTDIDWYGCEWEEYCEDCGEVLDYGIEHGSTYTEWDGCEWYEYCRDCDELMDYGDDHGYYTYTEWDGCEWYEYGDWESYDDSEHRRTASCSCGYSGYEYEDHEHSTVTDVSPKDAEQHTITYACDCGHTIEEPEDHTIIYGEWESCNDAEHSREVSCDCGYSDEEYDFHTDDDFDGYCDECDGMTSRFSVTLPAVMTIVVSGDGEVYAATNAAIVNNSTDKIIVSSVTVSAGDNWTLVPYGYNMANEKVDSRLIGFSLNGLSTTSFGYSETLEPSDWWIIDTDTPCTLDYDAVVSATSDVIQNEQVLTLVFVVNWLLL